MDTTLPTTVRMWLMCVVDIAGTMGILFYVALATHLGLGVGLMGALAALACLYYFVLVLSAP